MTTEDAFQATLDADPNDHTARLVFADYLEEEGDKRAAGIRVLGWSQQRPRKGSLLAGRNGNTRSVVAWHFQGGFIDDWLAPLISMAGVYGVLPDVWHREVWRMVQSKPMRPETAVYHYYIHGYVSTRREVEDIAARAFASLSKAVRADLMASLERYTTTSRS